MGIILIRSVKQSPLSSFVLLITSGASKDSILALAALDFKQDSAIFATVPGVKEWGISLIQSWHSPEVGVLSCTAIQRLRALLKSPCVAGLDGGWLLAPNPISSFTSFQVNPSLGFTILKTQWVIPNDLNDSSRVNPSFNTPSSDMNGGWASSSTPLTLILF